MNRNTVSKWKNNKINLKKSNINDNHVNNNGSKCKDIKNNKNTYKISLLTSMINKKNENEKIQIKRIPTKAKSNRPKTIIPLLVIDYILSIII
jgi:hypothetical protein